MKQKIAAYITSLRIRTLPLSLAGVILGALLSAADGYFKWNTFIYLIVTTLSLQILTNIANEIGDSKKGTDNAERLGPIFSIQSGILSMKEITAAMITSIIVAMIFGTLMIYSAFGNLLEAKSITLFIVGAISIFAAINYTMGANPYGYRGFGDLAVFIFFGLVSVLGGYYVMSGGIFKAINIMPATSIGLFAVGVLNLNNIRDINNDIMFNKRTIPSIIGIKCAKIYHFILIITGFFTLLIFSALTQSTWTGHLFILMFFILALPLFIIHLRAVARDEGKELDQQLKMLSILTLLSSLLISFGELFIN